MKKKEDSKRKREVGIQNGFTTAWPQKFKQDKFFRDSTSIVTGVFVVKYTLQIFYTFIPCLSMSLASR